MIKKIKHEISGNISYIYFGYFISILTILPLCIINYNNHPERIMFFSIVLMLLFLFSKFYRMLFSLLIAYISLMNILLWHIYIHWGYTGSIVPRIDVSIISPHYETLEYMRTYIDYRDVLFGLYSLCIWILLYLFIKYFRHSFKVLKSISSTLFIMIILMFVVYNKNPFRKIEPFSTPYDIYKSIHYAQIFNSRTKYLDSLDKNITMHKDLLYDKIIFIQGESVNKHHMSIYGYDQNTTPFFSSMRANKDFYIFNAIAPTNQTRYSVPIMHTPANVHDFKNAFIHSTSIADDLKQNSYMTYWISNQGKAGKYDDSIASLGHEANVSYFPNAKYTMAKPDGVLLKYINTMKNSGDNEMMVIHLIGSHVKYTDRYPQSIALFKNPSTIEESYDNTIFYTDYIVNKIFKYFMHNFHDKKILFIYVADHGEVVDQKKHGHGFNPTYKDEYEIPFVLYSTIPNKRIENLYTSNKKKYFNLENLNYMIKYIVGFTNEAHVSYSSDVFTLDPKNIVDFNRLKYFK